jgi:hypothetical protein
MDDLLDFRRIGFGQICGRWIAGEQHRRDLVDHLVGALRREDRRLEELERTVVHERAQLARRTWILPCKALDDGGGARTRSSGQGHRRTIEPDGRLASGGDQRADAASRRAWRRCKRPRAG